MDPVSQGLLGASCAQSISSPRKLMFASLAGGLSAMAPDLDVLIQSSRDPLLFLEYHRHFTHALAFIPIGAFICTAILAPFMKRHLSFAATYLACLAGYASHGPLDACTTYGTLLLWPFSNARIAWNNVSVIDPLFTIPIGILVIMALKTRRARYGRLALIWGTTYLLLGVVQTHRAAAIGHELALSRGHTPNHAQAMPSIANLWLWRHIYEHDGRFYVDAVRVTWRNRIYSGGSLEKLSTEKHFEGLDRESQQFHDIQRFSHFASDYLGISESDSNLIIDMRYSPVPNELSGIWAIRIDQNAPESAHVEFETERGATTERGKQLGAMILGKPLR